jgi:hypothetical protein
MLLRLSAGAVRVSRGTAVTPAAARRALVPPQQPRWVTVARAAERASGRRSLSATAEAATTPTAPKPTPSARPSTGSRRPGGEPSDQGPVSWKHFLATATIGGVLTAVFKYMEMRLADEKFRAVGRAALGGPFTLLDHNGDPKTVGGPSVHPIHLCLLTPGVQGISASTRGKSSTCCLHPHPSLTRGVVSMAG